MSLDAWLSRGKKVQIGGRELTMMPLPLSRLVGIGHWLEENCNDVVQEILSDMRSGKAAPNPLGMITQVLLRVDLSETALMIFGLPKDNDGNPINKNLTKQFFEDYLDIPTAHDLFNVFIEVNDLPNLVKNLQSLPIVKQVMEAWTLTFGIPFLTSLHQNTDLAQKTSGGSPTLKSTDMSMPNTSERQEAGKSENQQSPNNSNQRKEMIQ